MGVASSIIGWAPGEGDLDERRLRALEASATTLLASARTAAATAAVASAAQ